MVDEYLSIVNDLWVLQDIGDGFFDSAKARYDTTDLLNM